MLTNDLSAVVFHPWAHKNPSAVLEIEKGVSHCRATLQSDQHTVFAIFHVTGIVIITAEDIAHNPHPACVGHEFRPISQQTAGRDNIAGPRIGACF